MKVTLRIVALISVSIALAGSAQAQKRPAADPDWPCFQVKTPTFSLAAVWDGPPIDLESQAWRDDRNVADLAAKMADRRMPVSDVEASLAAFAKSGPEARGKLPIAFGAAFQALTNQRSQIIDGLERFGRRQRELADQIRSENETARSSANANPGGAQDAAVEKLQWDLRVFEDRRRETSYACESPTLIEQRIGALARAVRAAM
ncbi:MAG: hypothetical protein JO288_05700 [Hyphomicrobiales bacterium]|nr:hypothetical protein [Hyphomicrobiales bacterium]